MCKNWGGERTALSFVCTGRTRFEDQVCSVQNVTPSAQIRKKQRFEEICSLHFEYATLLQTGSNGRIEVMAGLK